MSVYITTFLALYFIFWGVIDIGMSAFLLKERLWAFPVSILLIAVFIAYEILRFFQHHSVFLLGIIAVDIVILLLIQREYSILRKRIHNASSLA